MKHPYKNSLIWNSSEILSFETPFRNFLVWIKHLIWNTLLSFETPFSHLKHPSLIWNTLLSSETLFSHLKHCSLILNTLLKFFHWKHASNSFIGNTPQILSSETPSYQVKFTSQNLSSEIPFSCLKHLYKNYHMKHPSLKWNPPCTWNTFLSSETSTLISNTILKFYYQYPSLIGNIFLILVTFFL